MIYNNKYLKKWTGNEATKHMDIWKEKAGRCTFDSPFYNVRVQVSCPINSSDVVLFEEFVYLLRRHNIIFSVVSTTKGEGNEPS
jgi:hypothetical protein